MPYYLSDDDFARIDKLLTAFEAGELRPKELPQQKKYPGTRIDTYIGYCSSTVSGYAAGVPGTGTGQMIQFASDNTHSDMPYTETIYNLYSTQISASTLCSYIREPVSGYLCAVPLASGNNFSGCAITNIDINCSTGSTTYPTWWYQSVPGWANFDTDLYVGGTGRTDKLYIPYAGMYRVLATVNLTAGSGSGSVVLNLNNYSNSYNFAVASSVFTSGQNFIMNLSGMGYCRKNDRVCLGITPTTTSVYANYELCQIQVELIQAY